MHGQPPPGSGPSTSIMHQTLPEGSPSAPEAAEARSGTRAHLGTRLNQRDRDILKDIIHTFIVSGEPVSSRAVAKHGRHSLSAASIRNVMADLVDLGLLSQPHTSAGRVPTRAAYHLYIESLMNTRRVPDGARRHIDDTLGERPGGAERLMATAGQLLSELTRQIGIVVTPTFGQTVLRAVDFVNLSGNKILCVLVGAAGTIENKVIETSEPVPRAELIRISNYLNDQFAGKGLREIRDELIALMAKERAKVDRLLANAIALAQAALSGGRAPELVVEGTEVLLHQPELSDLERVRRLLDTFSDRATMVQVLNRLIEGPGVRVLIGRDSDLTSELDFSLVATTYGVGDRQMGKLGIFGPSRMDYETVIPLVEYFGERLGQALEEAFEER